MHTSFHDPFGDLKLPGEPIWKIYPRRCDPVSDLPRAVKEALRSPIGSPHLGSIVKPGCSAAVVVDDMTRPTPQRDLLPPILDELERLGVDGRHVTVLIGSGVHRPMSGDEIRQRFGEAVTRRVGEILNHDARDEACTVVGRTSTGGAIAVNTRFIQADVRIVVGLIVPHVYAGWSGGAKMIQPGISSATTTTHVHRMANLHLSTILGNAENVVRHEMEEIARVAGLQFIVNVVLNHENQVVRVVAGDPVKAHREGVKTAAAVFSWQVPEAADIVVASTPACATDFWQSNKSIAGAVRAMKKDGTLVLLAPCPEGVAPGHPILLELGQTGFEEVLAKVDAGAIDDSVGALTHMTMSKCREGGEIVLVSPGVSVAEARNLGLKHACSVDDALEAALERHGRHSKIGLMIDAGDLVVTIGRQDLD